MLVRPRHDPPHPRCSCRGGPDLTGRCSCSHSGSLAADLSMEGQVSHIMSPLLAAQWVTSPVRMLKNSSSLTISEIGTNFPWFWWHWNNFLFPMVPSVVPNICGSSWKKVIYLSDKILNYLFRQLTDDSIILQNWLLGSRQNKYSLPRQNSPFLFLMAITPFKFMLGLKVRGVLKNSENFESDGHWNFSISARGSWENSIWKF